MCPGYSISFNISARRATSTTWPSTAVAMQGLWLKPCVTTSGGKFTATAQMGTNGTGMRRKRDILRRLKPLFFHKLEGLCPRGDIDQRRLSSRGRHYGTVL